jgi:hypothetical protein
LNTGDRTLLSLTLLGSLFAPSLAIAQTAQAYKPPQAHRQFVTVSYNWLYTYPLHFSTYPLEDLVGADVTQSDPPYDYVTRDGATRIDVLEFKRRAKGLGATVYPLGMNVGPTLGVRGSIEGLPEIRLAFDGPGPLDSYNFTNAVAYDIGAGVFVADRAPGFGLGSYAFVVGGVGKITSDFMGGKRYFAEGGGGLQSGPFGFELSVKFGWNMLEEPVPHKFLTVPINLRATVSF